MLRSITSNEKRGINGLKKGGRKEKRKKKTIETVKNKNTPSTYCHIHNIMKEKNTINLNHENYI